MHRFIGCLIHFDLCFVGRFRWPRMDEVGQIHKGQNSPNWAAPEEIKDGFNVCFLPPTQDHTGPMLTSCYVLHATS